MKSWMLVFCAAVALLADRKLEVAASVPDLADMAQQIGGDAVNVVTLATGREDLHAVPARPSFLPKLNRADLLLTLGLDAEHAWLPALAAEARNAKIREDGSGWINCSDGIAVLEVPKKLDRSEGEQHPEGNPHFNIGPQCGTTMAMNIEKALSLAMPVKADLFAANRRAYQVKLDTLIAELSEKGRILHGIPVIEYHPDIAYLSFFYGMKTVGSIEPKAGVPPTTAHLKNLAEQGRQAGVRLIIYNQSQNRKIPRKLAAEIGCQAVCIANAVGAQPGISTWIELQQYNLRQLLAGFAGAVR